MLTAGWGWKFPKTADEPPVPPSASEHWKGIPRNHPRLAEVGLTRDLTGYVRANDRYHVWLPLNVAASLLLPLPKGSKEESRSTPEALKAVTRILEATGQGSPSS